MSDFTNWPSIDTDLMRHAYATSVLEEFVRSHSYSDIIRELVQNEYDAEGRRLEVVFEEASIRISGNGKPIDAKGWNRLSVTLGTGLDPTTGRSIEEKVNSLGSKNFGLRSLFLFGNQIRIRSGGRWTILDAEKGTPKRPLDDPDSKGKAGVFIEVPYREAALGKLEPFGSEKLEHVFQEVISDLALTVAKLSQPGTTKRLSEIIVSSVQQNRRIRWVLSSSKINTSARGITAVNRKVRVHDGSLLTSHTRPSTPLEELEFQRSFEVPAKFRARNFPAYYRVSGGRIRIGLALPIKRTKVDLGRLGSFYYPLGTLEDHTGNLINVSAPFEMNADRSRIVAPEMSEWNSWLVEQAACLTTDLLAADWFKRFGADAYVAVFEQQTEETAYSNAVKARLKTERVWPTRVPRPKDRPEFKEASKVTFPARSEYEGILDNTHSLHQHLTHDHRLKAIAQNVGVKIFSVNSLVRLRCGGEKSSLATKVGNGQANYWYTKFPRAIYSIDRQVNIARALDASVRELTNENRQDLRRTETTLTGNNTLASASELWVVPPDLDDACPVPHQQRLHPKLLSFGVITRLCKSFMAKEWACDVAERAESGEATEDERESLYTYLLSPHRKLNGKTWTHLRRLPVLRNHRGQWVEPAAIMTRKVSGAELLEPAIHFPADAYAKDHEIAKIFRFRSRVEQKDVIRYAEMVEQDPALAEGFETALIKLKHLLSPKVIDHLKRIDFLRSSDGDVINPPSLYIRSEQLEACIGPEASYASGTNTQLYKILGCRQQPRAEDILDYLETLRLEEQGPPHPQTLYPKLVEAIGSNRISTARILGRAILWTGAGYSAPDETLIGSHPKLLGAVPQVPLSLFAPTVIKAYITLGAQRDPKPEHWIRLLQWISDRYRRGMTSVTEQERMALIEAYRNLRDFPSEINDTARCLLDQNRRLHSRTELKSGRFLIRDDERTAKACLEQRVPVTFADCEARTIHFFQKAGVQRLSAIRRRVGLSIGHVRLPAAELRVKMLLERLHSPDLASAIATLIRYDHPGRQTPTKSSLHRKLRALREVVVADPLEIEYSIAAQTIHVPTEAVLDGERIIISGGRSVKEVSGLLAYPLAELLIEGIQDQKSIGDAIYRLLTEDSPKGMQRYLESRNVPWKPDNESTDRPDREAENEEVRERLSALFSDSLGEKPLTPAPAPRPEPVPLPPAPAPLPPIESVLLKGADPSGSWSPVDSHRPGTARGGHWSPSRRNETRDREVGDRAEELIFGHEQQRVQAAGHCASVVRWIAREYPNADHDILSVDDSGNTIYIEVKATTGQDGRFQWTKAEFERALQARECYWLYRVYLADTTSPFFKVFRDPINLFLEHGMRLDTAALYGEVEPLS